MMYTYTFEENKTEKYKSLQYYYSNMYHSN